MATPAITRLQVLGRNEGKTLQNFITAPTWVDNRRLAAGVAETYTVPTGGVICRLTPTVIPCYGNVNGAATIPAADVTDGSASFPVGGQTYMVLEGGQNLSLICASTCDVTIEVWS